MCDVKHMHRYTYTLHGRLSGFYLLHHNCHRLEEFNLYRLVWFSAGLKMVSAIYWRYRGSGYSADENCWSHSNDYTTIASPTPSFTPCVKELYATQFHFLYGVLSPAPSTAAHMHQSWIMDIGLFPVNKQLSTAISDKYCILHALVLCRQLRMPCTRSIWFPLYKLYSCRELHVSHTVSFSYIHNAHYLLSMCASPSCCSPQHVSISI